MEKAAGASFSLWRLSLCQLPCSSGNERRFLGKEKEQGQLQWIQLEQQRFLPGARVGVPVIPPSWECICLSSWVLLHAEASQGRKVPIISPSPEVWRHPGSN